MRIVFVIVSLCSSLVFASELSIKTISSNSGMQYELHAGAFSVQENAEKLKNTLSKQTSEPILIEHLESKGLYLVRVGPFKDYNQAAALRKQINASSKPINALSQSPEVKKDTPHKVAPKVWNLRNADIRAVISEVSRVTGKNFIIDPRVQGKISIASSSPISNKELYQVFLSMLQVSGYAAIPNDDVIKIIPTIEAKSQSPDVLNNMRNRPRGEEVMVEVIPVRYVPAEQLVPVLRPLMPPTSNVSAYGPSNMLILSGRASNIKQLAYIITQVDNSSANDIDIVPLRHALAMDIVNTLKDLVRSPSGSSAQQTTIAADDRSNAVLVSGSKTERIKLRLLIVDLDRESRFGNNNTTQVVYLSYRRAQDLVPILASIAQANFTGPVGTTVGTITQPALDSTNPTTSFATNSNSQAQSNASLVGNQSGATSASSDSGKGSATTSQTEGVTKPTVQIIAEPNTNSIIINAPVSVIQILKSVVSQLDIRPSQVLIEGLVAEINENDFKRLGIEWGTVTESTDGAQTFQPGFAIINSKVSIDQFQAQVYALARERRANILSTPSVVVLDNRQAKILIGKQVSVATTSYPNNAGGTTTASPFTTFDRVNVALHLYVRPQITRGKGIELQIDEGNDTLDTANSIDPSVNPTFNISSIVTSVHVDSGDVVVLGGLKQDSLSNDDTGIPIIGKIPGLGRLFQYNQVAHDKKVLMVFIKPQILRTEKDTVQVSGGKYSDVRQTQLEFVRDQEEYDKRDMKTVLPPERSAKLPKPFCRVPKKLKPMTK